MLSIGVVIVCYSVIFIGCGILACTGMQGLKDAYEALMLNDNILQLLCNAHEVTSLVALIAFSKAMFETIHSEQDQIQTFCQSNVKVQELIKPVIDRSLRFHKTVLALFQAEAIGFAEESHDVISFLNFTGKDVFEKAVKKILSLDSPEQDSSMKQEACTFLRKLVKDVVKTAASTKILLPKMQTMKAALESLEMEHVEIETLLEAGHMVPQFRDGLRKGMSEDFEKTLKSCLLEHVATIVKAGDAGTSTITSDQLAKLDKSLQLMEEDQHILAAQGSLRQFASKHNSSLAIRDLREWGQEFVKEALQNSSTVLNIKKFGQLRDILVKCVGKKLPTELKSSTGAAVYYMLKDVILHVPCRALGVIGVAGECGFRGSLLLVAGISHSITSYVLITGPCLINTSILQSTFKPQTVNCKVALTSSLLLKSSKQQQVTGPLTGGRVGALPENKSILLDSSYIVVCQQLAS